MLTTAAKYVPWSSAGTSSRPRDSWHPISDGKKHFKMNDGFFCVYIYMIYIWYIYVYDYIYDYIYIHGVSIHDINAEKPQ